MQNSIKKKKLIVSILAMLFVLFACLGSLVWASATETPIYNGPQLEQSYSFGQKLTLPEATIKYGGATKRAGVRTAYPSGKTAEENVIYLTEEGVYTVTFFASFDGIERGVDQKFSVKKKLFSVQKETSSVEYGSYYAREHGGDKYKVSGSVTGAYVELSAGDKLTYNKVINLNGKTSLDSIVRVVLTPSTIGAKDAGALNIILTDAYNPKNYVTINALYDAGNAAAYTKVAASNGQALSGWDYGGNRLLSGTNPFGYAIYCLFDGYQAKRASTHNEISNNYFDVAMDYKEKSVHAKGNYNSKYPSMIADLDNADDYGIVWEGFTTGECFLSISFGDYVGQTANFVVQSIMGEQITSNGDFTRTKPKLEVDYKGYDKNSLPKGQVGKAYNLFDVEYNSPYFSNLKLEQKVYFDYNGKKESVEIVNGTFTPTKKGEYVVEVTVTDALEQKVVETYVVNVVDQDMPIFISVSGNPQITGKAGEYIEICNVQTNGGSGKINVEYFVTLNGENIQIEDNAFFPTAPGEYKVKIKATDFLGTEKEYEYSVHISPAVKPVFATTAIMPKYLISGNQIQLPEIYAKDYITGSNKDVKAEILYQDANGIKRAVNGKITPVVRNNGDLVKITYKATIGQAVETIEYQVPTIIVRDGDIQIERLFVAKGANVVNPTDERYVEFRFFNDTEYEFINPLAANGIDVRFSADSLGVNYKKIVVTLTDIYNQEQSIKLNYTLKGSKTEFNLNDSTVVYNTEKVLGRANSVLAFTMDTFTNELKFDTSSSKKVSLKTYANGKEFKGFDSGLVYLTFGFEDVKGVSTFRVNNISGKFLEDTYEDLARPKIAILGNYGGNYKPGEIVALPKIVATDVLDGVLPVTMSVTAPDGSYVTDENGLLLYNVEVKNNHSIKLSEYGSYKVSLKVMDKDENSNSTSFVYKIEYDIPPVIKVEDVPTSGKVGEKIVLPTAIVEHNALGGKTTLIMYLITDTGNIYKLNSPAFVPQRAGVYSVRYYCIDELGNSSLLSFDISVV